MLTELIEEKTGRPMEKGRLLYKSNWGDTDFYQYINGYNNFLVIIKEKSSAWNVSDIEA